MHRPPIAAPALALLMSAGCYSYRVAPTPVPPHTFVRVRFDPPRPFAVVSRDGDTLLLNGVTALEGRVLNAWGDTLRLELAAARGRSSMFPGVRGSRATVAAERGRPAEVRRVSGATKAVAVLAGAAAVVVGLLVIYVVTVWGDT